MPLTYVVKTTSAQQIPAHINKEIKRLLNVAESEVSNAKTRTVRANKEGKVSILRYISGMLENMQVEIEGTPITADEVWERKAQEIKDSLK